MYVRLGRDVNLCRGKRAMHLGNKAQVLDDEGVGTRVEHTARRGNGTSEFCLLHDNVHRHVDANAASVGEVA